MFRYSGLVSVIVPVYGTEEYLSSCIESIRKQSYRNLQIILVDDQSPDKCPEICDSYAQIDERILVIHQKNKGVSGARNTGIRNATGDYIMFVDSDDELYPDAVTILLEDALKNDADIVSAKKCLYGKSGEILCNNSDGDLIIYKGEESLLLSLNGENNTNSSCAKLFKSKFIQDVFFEEGKNIHEDGFFIFQCYMKKPKLIQHNVSVYKYNYRMNSNSRQIFSDKYLSMLYFCEEKERLISHYYPQYIPQTNNMKVRTHLQFLQVLCRTKEKKYKKLQRQSIAIIRCLHKYHKPINKHHKKLAWIVKIGLYPVYKIAVRLKYYR